MITETDNAFIKESEDDSDVIIRGCEYAGSEQECVIVYSENIFRITVDAYEIFTVKINGIEIKKINMTEN